MTDQTYLGPEIIVLVVTPGELKNTLNWSPPSNFYGNVPVILTRLPPFTTPPEIAHGTTTYVDEEVEPGKEYVYNVCCMDSRGLQSAPMSSAGVPLEEEEEELPPPPTGTLYVSPNGDANSPGTSASTPTTVAHALAIVNPGETVVFLDGTYTTTVPVATGTAVVNVTRSGTLTQPITLKAQNEANALIENPGGYGIYCKNISYVTLEGFAVQNCSLKGIAARESSPTAPMTGNVIKKCTIFNTTQEGMYLSQWSYGLIEDCFINTVGLSGVETTGHGIYLANAGSKNVTFRRVHINLTLQAVGAAIHMNGDISSSAGTDGVISGILIEDCRLFGGIKGVSGDGLTNSTVRNCIIDIQKNGARFGHGIRIYQSDASAGPQAMRIYNNTIRCGTGGSASAIRLTSEPGAQTAVFNNLTISNDQYYFTGPSASNLNGANFDTTTYAPNATAQAGGVPNLNGVDAPVSDINGNARSAPVTIGAIE